MFKQPNRLGNSTKLNSGFFKLMHKKERCHVIYQTNTGAATKLTDT